jgi:hypothetical protein
LASQHQDLLTQSCLLFQGCALICLDGLFDPVNMVVQAVGQRTLRCSWPFMARAQFARPEGPTMRHAVHGKR